MPLSPSTRELTAIYLRERLRFRNSDVAVSDARREGPEGSAAGTEPITLKGPSEPGDLVPGLTYRFFGTWKTYIPRSRWLGDEPESVEQFCFVSYVPAAPHTKHGVLCYLEQAPGVGRATASLLWECFGSAAVERLRTDPTATCRELAFRHFPVAKAIRAAEWLAERCAYEDCSIDLLDLLKGRGFPKATFRAAVRTWGNRAAEFLRRSPYRLMRFRGCGFLRCDQMYLALGGNPGARKRQALAAQYVLASDSEGHTWQPVAVLEREVRRLVSGVDVDLPRALLLAKRAGLVRTRRDEGNRLWLGASGRADSEATVAECVGRMLRDGEREEAERAAREERARMASVPFEAIDPLREPPTIAAGAENGPDFGEWSTDLFRRIVDQLDLVADAKAHAAATGRCMFCGLELTHPTSIAHGYGPTCAANHGLPWDATIEVESGEVAAK